MHLDLSDHIEEIEFAFEADGLGLINIRQAIYAKVRFNEAPNGREKIPGTVTKVRS